MSGSKLLVSRFGVGDRVHFRHNNGGARGTHLTPLPLATGVITQVLLHKLHKGNVYGYRVNSDCAECYTTCHVPDRPNLVWREHEQPPNSRPT